MYSCILLVTSVLNIASCVTNWTKCENDTIGCFQGECFINHVVIQDDFRICICEKGYMGDRCETSIIPPFAQLTKTENPDYTPSLICIISCFSISIILAIYSLIYYWEKIVIKTIYSNQNIENECSTTVEL